ncbi:MAG: DUF5110 domain-containing protein [Anaerolineae bacterium]|nr:DUF5110 domain-containing protein [Anaerolineae bacterium]
MPGLDPLWLINHLHFYDLGRDGTRRPFIFSRWGDKGHQRYPIGFSGDSYATWDSLRFQPYMTATASNIAYGWWSHDIGGHTSGDSSGELFARWVQFGVFSPILRIHSTKGYFFDRRPWVFDAEVAGVLRDALQLRHALIPYLYTMAWRAHEESLPLMLPMYYAYPEADAAYACPQQYLFGTELIAAPFVEPADADTRLSRQVVWLPEGDWYHFFSGEHYDGDRWHAIYGTLRDMPLFARAGAIVPMGKTVGWGGIDNPTDLHLHLFAGADNSFTLYEDDGETGGYLSGRACRTQLHLRWGGDRLTFTMESPTGDLDLIPAERSIQLSIHGVKGTGTIVALVDGSPLTVFASYDAETETLRVEGIRLASASALEVTIQSADDSLIAHRDRRREKLLRLVGVFRLNIGVRNRFAEELDANLDNPDAVAPLLLPMTASQVQALAETLYDAGVYHVHDAHDPDLLVLWNNREDANITYRYGDAYLFFGFVQSAQHHNGVVPRFMAIRPVMRTWADGALSERVHPTLWRVQVDYHNLATTIVSRVEETP